MVEFIATIHRFDKQGEKTGWTYIEVPVDIAGQLKPGTKTSYRVKGKLDHHKIEGVALLPMGAGRFIIPLNATMRKAIGKRQGAQLRVQLAVDPHPFRFNPDFLACLSDEPAAQAFFNSLPGSHQRYFSKWIDDAKTELTRTKRIAQAVNALSVKLGYGEMLRMSQKK